MSLNFKEKFQSINKKQIAIIGSIIIILSAASVWGYKSVKTRNAQNQQAAEIIEESILVKGTAEESNARPIRPSDYKIGIEYNKAIKGDKPVVVLFYADWCRYCIGFMPTFQTLSKIYKNEYNFTKVNVEDPKYEKIVKEADLTGFPTVYLMDSKYDNKVLLSNALFSDLKKLRIELDRFARIRSILDKK